MQLTQVNRALWELWEDLSLFDRPRDGMGGVFLLPLAVMREELAERGFTAEDEPLLHWIERRMYPVLMREIEAERAHHKEER